MTEKKNEGSWLEGFLGLLFAVFIIVAIGGFMVTAVYEIFFK